jgi:hypothetical protein
VLISSCHPNCSGKAQSLLSLLFDGMVNGRDDRAEVGPP